MRRARKPRRTPASVRRAMRHPDRYGAGAKKRRRLRSARNKARAVMGEFKRGTLHSGGSGRKVTSRRQAIAIAMSESRRSASGRRKRRAVRRY